MKYFEPPLSGSKAICHCAHGPGGLATPAERRAAEERAALLTQLVAEPSRLWTKGPDVDVVIIREREPEKLARVKSVGSPGMVADGDDAVEVRALCCVPARAAESQAVLTPSSARGASGKPSGAWRRRSERRRRLRERWRRRSRRRRSWTTATTSWATRWRTGTRTWCHWCHKALRGGFLRRTSSSRRRWAGWESTGLHD